MQAKDVMTSPPITVRPATEVQEVARCLLEFSISAVPVLDESGKLLGIISEGDLMQRRETGTERRASWWFAHFAAPEVRAADYLKVHGRRASDVMTEEVITVPDDADLSAVSAIMEKHRVKRLPVMRGGELAGIVSRSDLLHGLADWRPPAAVAIGDEDICTAVLAAFDEASVRAELLNVVVADGVVDLWGVTRSRPEIRAAGAAAENCPGVRAVHNYLSVFPLLVRNSMGAV